MHNINFADPGILLSRYYLGYMGVRLLRMPVNIYYVELGDFLRVVLDSS